MANRSDREQGQPNLSLRRHSLNNRMGPCSRTPSGPAVSTDCINRPDRRLHPTNATASIYLLQRGSHPQRTQVERRAMSVIYSVWRPMAEQVAGDDPAIAANKAQAKANNGSRLSSLDHLVRARQQRRRQDEAERFCRL